MGAVFAARDELLDRPVALKLLHCGSGEDELVAEARALAALDHPNVVRIHGLQRVADRVFVVMQRIEGRSLDEVLTTDGPLGPHAAVDVVRAVAAALEAVHRAGRIHGDVKPSNILIENGTRRVLLTDFGLSSAIADPRASTVVRGTPDYLAPERATGASIARELRPREDVYSLAATAFDLLTGRPPFDDDDPRAILRKHAFATPPRPTDIRPGLPWRIDRAVLAGLAKRPEARTATPLELAADLADAVSRGTTPPRVLVADDDGGHRQLLAHALAKRIRRVTIEAVSDGERAYRAASDRAPDLAILDLDMPGLNGLELAIALRSVSGLERLPVVVVSGFLGPNERAILDQIGVGPCFEKPVELAQLAVAVQRLLGAGSEAPRAAGR
jgi:serine/threonine protein kinase